MLKTKDVLNYLVNNYSTEYIMMKRSQGIKQFAKLLTKMIDCSFYCASKAVFEYPYYLTELCEGYLNE